MKKLLIFCVALILCCNNAFSKKKDSLVPLSMSALSEAEKQFGVMAFKKPLENFVTLDDKFIRFGNYNLFGGEQILDSFTITQKKKKYVMKIQDASTSVSYGWEAYFKLINDENKVVQVIHKKDMEDAVFALYDCDFDGYNDLVFYTATEKACKRYHVFYWNQTMKRFDKSPDKITNPFYDVKNRLVVTSQVTGNGQTLCEYWRILGGGRKFVARVRVGVYEGKAENGISLAYTTKKNANFETSADVYLYDFPTAKEFNEMNDAQKKEAVRQYDVLMKKINGIS